MREGWDEGGKDEARRDGAGSIEAGWDEAGRDEAREDEGGKDEARREAELLPGCPSVPAGPGPRVRAVRSDLGTSGVHSLGAGGAARGWQGCRKLRSLKVGSGWRGSPPQAALTF